MSKKRSTISISSCITSMVKKSNFISEERDGSGYYWSILDQFKKTDCVEIFWSNDTLVVRQENDGEVDMVHLTIPQVYDMLAVLSRAISVGPKV